MGTVESSGDSEVFLIFSWDIGVSIWFVWTLYLARRSRSFNVLAFYFMLDM